MAAKTSKGFRYPQNADAPNIAVDFQNLATDIDTYLNAPQVTTSIVFEGATADSFELTLQATDPTADRTITLPDSDGTIALTSSVTSEAEILNRSRVTSFMLGGM